MNKYAMMAVASLLVIGACSRNPSTDETATTDQTTTTTTAETAAPPMPAQPAMSTQDFVNAAATTDMFEIQSGKLAATKAKSADLKAFAKMLVDDHTKTTAQLKAASKTASFTLPTDLTADQAAMLADLKTADAASFDQKYLSYVGPAHEKAVNTFQSYASNGDNAELKQWASATLPTLQSHLDKATALQSSMSASPDATKKS